MPIHVSPLSRRQWLTQSAAGVAGIGFVGMPMAMSEESPIEREIATDRIALLSDTHIPGAPDVMARGVNMTDNLKRVVSQLCELDPPPVGVIINGDCAYLKGLPNDYANLAACVAPLAAAELPLHLTMGNHDDRGPLYQALADQRPENPPVDSKHVSVIEMKHANFFLLDSLKQVDVVTGQVGESQLSWLSAALGARADKPAVVVVHHNPQFTPPAAGMPWTGIEDTAALFACMDQHAHVKAFVFGHSHDWSVNRRGKVHMINLPPVAYVFAEDRPNGWVDARVTAAGLELNLRTLNESDARHGLKISLPWNG
jgi:Icc protein